MLSSQATSLSKGWLGRRCGMTCGCVAGVLTPKLSDGVLFKPTLELRESWCIWWSLSLFKFWFGLCCTCWVPTSGRWFNSSCDCCCRTVSSSFRMRSIRFACSGMVLGIAGRGVVYASSSQEIPRETQFEHGASLLHRNFRVLQSLQLTGRWRGAACDSLGIVSSVCPWKI